MTGRIADPGARTDRGSRCLPRPLRPEDGLHFNLANDTFVAALCRKHRAYEGDAVHFQRKRPPNLYVIALDQQISRF